MTDDQNPSPETHVPEPMGYLKPDFEDAIEPRYIKAEERTQDWQRQVFTIPVYAAPQTQIAVTCDHIERLQHAVEGECDGLMIDGGQALAILSYVVNEAVTSSDHVGGDRFEIHDSHFGQYIKPSLPEGCDMIVVYANEHGHVPVWLGLPHQLYVETAKHLLAKHGGDHLTIVPYRNRDKFDVPGSALATEGKADV